MKSGLIVLVLEVTGDDEERDAEVVIVGPTKGLVQTDEGLLCKTCVEATEEQKRRPQAGRVYALLGDFLVREHVGNVLCDACLLEQTIGDMGLSYVLDSCKIELGRNGYLQLVLWVKAGSSNHPDGDDYWEEWTCESQTWFDELPGWMMEARRQREEETQRFEEEAEAREVTEETSP